jgi:predicted phage tail protein
VRTGPVRDDLVQRRQSALERISRLQALTTDEMNQAYGARLDPERAAQEALAQQVARLPQKAEDRAAQQAARRQQIAAQVEAQGRPRQVAELLRTCRAEMGNAVAVAEDHGQRVAVLAEYEARITSLEGELADAQREANRPCVAI